MNPRKHIFLDDHYPIIALKKSHSVLFQHRMSWLTGKTRMSGNPYKPKLIFTGEPFAGRVCELTAEKITVGRGNQNTLAIHHPSVSQTHCEILVNGPEVIVRDLQSSNGTFVEGVRIHPQSQVKHGQSVWFGDVAARLELAPPPSSEQTTLTDQTAVHEHARIVRDLEQEKKSPKPADVSLQLGSDAESEATLTGKTSILHSAALTGITPAPAGSAAHEISNRKPHRKIWIIVVLATVGVAVLLWVLFRSS